MKVFLTGATGFIGAHVARLLLERGHEVHALIRPGSDTWRVAEIISELRVVEGDMTAVEGFSSEVRRIQPELSVLLAWYAEPGKYLAAPANVPLVGATLRLASELAEAGCRRLLAAGTCFEYDTDIGYLSEATPTRPRSLYAASKLALHLVLDQYGQETGIAAAWLRFFYQYGPFEDRRRLVPSVILSLLEGRSARVTEGEQIRDFLHIEDVARAVVAVGESALTGPVNIGSGRPISVRDLVRRVGTLMGRAELIHFGAIPQNPKDPKFVCADNRKLKEGTAWQPRFDLDQGILHTLEWWQRHQNSPRESRAFG